MIEEVHDDDMPIKQIGVAVWDLDYSKIDHEIARNKYIEFANYSKKLFLKQFYEAFNIDFEDRFEFVDQCPEGWDCRMTMLARESYRYRDKVTGKLLNIYIEFDCNDSCRDIFLTHRKCSLYSLKGYEYYIPDIDKCEVKLRYELPKYKSNNFECISLRDINNGNIDNYLHY